MEFFKRAIVSHPNAVKVLISGYLDEGEVRGAFELGVHAFVEKPFSLTALLEQLAVHIENGNIHRKVYLQAIA